METLKKAVQARYPKNLPDLEAVCEENGEKDSLLVILPGMQILLERVLVNTDHGGCQLADLISLTVKRKGHCLLQ